MKQPPLGGRRRNVDGEISRKHGHKRIAALRGTFGIDFAPGVHGNSYLGTALQTLERKSLNQLVKNPPKKPKGR